MLGGVMAGADLSLPFEGRVAAQRSGGVILPLTVHPLRLAPLGTSPCEGEERD
jgi:hypothetical protein